MRKLIVERISATDAARKFSDLLNRVRYQESRFEIVRGTEVVAQVIPANLPHAAKLAELDEQFAQLPKLDPEDADAFAEDIAVNRDNLAAPQAKWD